MGNSRLIFTYPPSPVIFLFYSLFLKFSNFNKLFILDIFKLASTVAGAVGVCKIVTSLQT